MELNQITVPTHDMAASVAFYKRLGFRQLVDTAHYARFLAPEGDTTFSLHLEEGYEPAGKTVVYLETHDLDEVVAKLQAAGLTFTSAPKDERWLWREARLLDPAGNQICIYYAGENRINPPWRITQSEE
ncbi:MAG: VOC family protein [Pseudomonadota bacterium]